MGELFGWDAELLDVELVGAEPPGELAGELPVVLVGAFDGGGAGSDGACEDGADAGSGGGGAGWLGACANAHAGIIIATANVSETIRLSMDALLRTLRRNRLAGWIMAGIPPLACLKGSKTEYTPGRAATCWL
jgi:hypothetical protein